MNNAPRRQHTVTKAVLKRFTDPSSGSLEAFDFSSGAHSLRRPEKVGYVLDFISHNAQQYENKWQTSENKLGLIYDSYAKGVLHTLPEAIEAAKDLIALHAARSRTMIHVINLSRERGKQGLITELLMNHRGQLQLGFQQRTGLIATGTEALILQAEFEAEREAATTETGSFIGWRVESNYDDLQKLLARTSIQVLVADSNSRRFMIGDDPSPSLKENFNGLGPLGGVPWPEAISIGLPMSPDFAIALKNKAELIEITDIQVEILNRIQMSNAESSVFYRPDPLLRKSAQEVKPFRDARTDVLDRHILPRP